MLLCREFDNYRRSLVRALLNIHLSAVKLGNFPNQRKPQSDSAVFAASRLIDSEKGLENNPLIFLGDAAAGILDFYFNSVFVLINGNPHFSARPVILDGVFRKIKNKPVYKRVAARHCALSVIFQGYIVVFGKRGDIRKYFLYHRGEIDKIVSRHGLQAVHFEHNSGRGGSGR